MPAPALKSLADKAGKSLKAAERYYDDAKKQRMKATGKKDKALGSDDYKYIMGVVKKRLGLKTESIRATDLIESRIAEGDFDVRVFRDLDGEISFCSTDDVHIEPASDPRVLLIHKLANEYVWPHSHPFPESLEGYEGSITTLAQSVLDFLSGGVSEVAGPANSRHRSLAQKQGARRGARTRERRQYRESTRLEERAGYLHHNYYKPKNDNP